MKKFAFILFSFVSALGFATHNRAGEILYQRIDPKTQVVGGVTVPYYKYLITVVKYTDDGTPAGINNTIQDRCTDTVYFGDGQKEPLQRTNGGSPLCSGCIPCGCPHCGEIIVNDPTNGYRVKLNTYTVTHVYPGAGTFTISTSDPNRNDGVYNMFYSGQQAFYIQSVLWITNFSGANTSPQFKNPPIDEACVGKCFYHDPGAYDPDGDSLSFELSTPKGANGQTVAGYTQPGTYPGGTFAIDPILGKLTWCTPTLTTEFNLAFIVKEWRKNTDTSRILIGTVLRDMQVIVVSCSNNNPPGIILPKDTCVEAGTLIQKSIRVTDLLISPPSDPSANLVTLSGSAGAFSAPGPQALLSNTFAATPYTALFNWQTSCEQVREQPYRTVFKAEDQGPGNPLVNFSTYSIKVVPPSVNNVLAVPQGFNINLSWDPAACNPTANPLKGYLIYRKNNCEAYVHSPCEVGVNAVSGFSLITKTPLLTATFTDTNGGTGLTVGEAYSYLVIAVYADRSQSYAGSPVCVQLKRDVPLLLNVDVLSTSVSTGSVYVRWLNPQVDHTALDTITFKGPYQLILKYRRGNSGSFLPIYTSTSPYFLGLDTAYTHSNINTVDSPAYYQMLFIAGAVNIGTSNIASSVLLSAVPSDRKIKLTWKAATPWNNYQYSIYRKDPSAANYVLHATTVLSEYTDTVHVVNRYVYCYKILSEGQYSDPGIARPLLNNSQVSCALAKDLTAPCPPSISLDANCRSGFLNVSWSNVSNPCSDDVLKRVLFYKPTLEDPYMVVDTFNTAVTVYSYDGVAALSGCYALQAVDSSGNASVLSADLCTDICPEFELPNIFSPNNDKVNDVYKAVKVKQIKEINLSIFDRWGTLVYKTTDPYFQWDGISLQSKILVSDETFFYICQVFEPHVTGIRKRELKGYLQVVR